MQKIKCECCQNRRGDYGIWIVFGSIIICETCRLKTIDTMRMWGFGFDHPFMTEFAEVNESVIKL